MFIMDYFSSERFSSVEKKEKLKGKQKKINCAFSINISLQSNDAHVAHLVRHITPFNSTSAVKRACDHTYPTEGDMCFLQNFAKKVDT
jgi:hypothetical protein